MNLKPRYVLWLGIELATFQLQNNGETNWATLARAESSSLPLYLFLLLCTFPQWVEHLSSQMFKLKILLKEKKNLNKKTKEKNILLPATLDSLVTFKTFRIWFQTTSLDQSLNFFYRFFQLNYLWFPNDSCHLKSWYGFAHVFFWNFALPALTYYWLFNFDRSYFQTFMRFLILTVTTVLCAYN